MCSGTLYLKGDSRRDKGDRNLRPLIPDTGIGCGREQRGGDLGNVPLGGHWEERIRHLWGRSIGEHQVDINERDPSRSKGHGNLVT